MRRPDFPYMIEKRDNGWRVTAFKDSDRYTCEGVCPEETTERALKMLLEIRMRRGLASLGMFILPTDGI